MPGSGRARICIQTYLHPCSLLLPQESAYTWAQLASALDLSWSLTLEAVVIQRGLTHGPAMSTNVAGKAYKH